MRKPLLILVLTLNILLHAATAVTLKVSPAFQFAPGYVRAQIAIEPDEHNRGFCFFYDGAQSGSTCRDLDGAKAQRTRWVELRDLPAGAYSGQVRVERDDKSIESSGTVEWQILESADVGR